MTKIQRNRVIAEAKKSYWTEFCKNEVSESKDTRNKVWRPKKKKKKKKERKKERNEKWI